MSHAEELPVDGTLDATGLNCPEPVMMLHQHIRDLPAGGLLKVIATDPGSWRDFEAFARQTGNELVQQGETADKAFEFFLKRK